MNAQVSLVASPCPADVTAVPKIELRGVDKAFPVRDATASGPLYALRGMSLAVPAGAFVTLVGPSGCGKSTLLDLLAGLTQPTAGQVLLDGRPLSGPGLDRGVVFQQYALFPWRTALQNIAFGLETQGIGRRAREQVALEYLQLVGLEGFGDRYPHELSGGMKQRVAIARALAYDPDVLLMDEPFAALDAQTRETLQAELLRIWARTRKTVLFITHDIDEAVYLGERLALMSARPGCIERLFEMPRALREQSGEDRRAAPIFGETRHVVWTALRQQVEAATSGQRGPTIANVPDHDDEALETGASTPAARPRVAVGTGQ